MNIVLVGLMGVGKTSVGRLLADALGRPFVDTDEWIVEHEGRTIPAIFAAEGEDGFRQREENAIAAVASVDGQVIATGGGAVLRPANREALRQTGIVFWLDAPPEELYRRAAAQGVEARPLLAEGDALERLRALAESRAEAYRAAAHHRVQAAGRSPEEVAAEILAILGYKRESEGEK